MKKALQGKAWFIPPLVLILAGLAFWYGRENRGDTSALVIGSPSPPGSPASLSGGPTPKKNAPALPSTEKLAPAFVSAFQAEARAVDSPRVDPVAAEARVLEMLSQMGEEEVLYAKNLVLAPEAPANQKLFAAYLIAKGGEKTQRAAAELVTQTFQSDRAEPDTVEEHKNVQAKSYALIAVYEKAKEAETSSAAREELVRWARDAKDSTLKKEIESALRRLPKL